MDTQYINFPSSIRKFPAKSLKGQYCLSPFIMIQITANGAVRLCGCGSWMPSIVGNIFESSLEQMLSSKLAQDIRQSIIDGTYVYCNEKQCAVMINDGLNTIDTIPPNVLYQLEDSSRFDMPYEISLHGELTCNLSCPSCRTGIIKTSPDEEQRQIEIGDLVYKNILGHNTDKHMHIITSGSGEVFASPMLLGFLGKVDPINFPNLKISLCSNGLLAKSRWPRIKHLESLVKKITISVDATTAETYEKLRRGGKWVDLLENIDFLKDKCEEIDAKFHTRMIVQQQNYQEALEFYEWSRQRGVDVIEYSQINNWGTWTPDEFRRHNIFDPSHPEYTQAQDIISQLKKLPNVFFEGIA
jgi:wyosine [tRNA(Phe)-imidazoG37] synthetase (radical SAM superfamily)